MELIKEILESIVEVKTSHYKSKVFIEVESKKGEIFLEGYYDINAETFEIWDSTVLDSEGNISMLDVEEINDTIKTKIHNHYHEEIAGMGWE